MAQPDVVVPIWQEERRLHGGNATVSARVAQPAGVGWVDLEVALPSHQMFQRRRLIADWAGRTDAEMARAVISLADDWFAYCAEQAEREQVVGALADPSAPVASERLNIENLMRAESDRQLNALRVWQAGLISAPPESGQYGVEGVLAPLAGRAAIGSPEHPGNGLRDLGDHVPEPEV